MTNSPPLEISVIIPTVNRREVLRRVLEALAGQTYPRSQYEIIVVDDGSSDGTREMVDTLARERMPNLRYARQVPGKRGPAAANNLGIGAARGECILFLNDDVVADPRLIEEHMKLHRASGDIIVQGRVVNTASLEDLGRRHAGYSGGYTDLSFGYFTTWNCSIGKALLVRAGLFDEEFVELCWEDVELGYRLRALGVRQRRNRAALGYHFKPEFTLNGLGGVRRKSINMGKNAMIYYRKHPRLDVKISTQSFWLPMGVHSLLRLALRLIGRERAMAALRRLEQQGRKRLLSTLVGLAGYYWYLSGVKEARAAGANTRAA